MAFNRRIMLKLEDACGENEAMLGYMRDIVTFEMREAGRYKSDYEDFLKKRAKEEAEEGVSE